MNRDGSNKHAGLKVKNDHWICHPSYSSGMLGGRGDRLFRKLVIQRDMAESEDAVDPSTSTARSCLGSEFEIKVPCKLHFEFRILA